MPALDKNAGEQMLIHHFLMGLPTTISQQLRATREAKELAKVVERAHLLMTIDNHGSLQNVAATGTTATQPQDKISHLKDQIEVLTQQVAALATQKSAHSRNRSRLMQCFNCNGLGHFPRSCPSRTQGRPSRFTHGCFKCGQLGHTQKECFHQGNGEGCLDWVPDTLETEHGPTCFLSYCGYNQERCSNYSGLFWEQPNGDDAGLWFSSVIGKT